MQNGIFVPVQGVAAKEAKKAGVKVMVRYRVIWKWDCVKSRWVTGEMAPMAPEEG